MKNICFDLPVSRAKTSSVKWEKYKNSNVIPMWVADMDFSASIPIQKAMQTRVTHPIYGYTAPPPELVSTVCGMLLKKYDWEIDPSWIVWLPGTLPGIAAGCRAFSEQGDEIAFYTPAFSEFFRVVRHSRRNALTIPFARVNERWTFDFDRLRELITPRTRVMLLCSPNNPTGTVFTSDELKELCQICKENEIVILSDEVHAGLVLDPDKKHIPTALTCAEYAEQVVTLMSPSKTYNLGGVNCAYAIIKSENLRNKFIAECEGFGIMPMASALPFAATLAAYRDSSEWYGNMIEYLWDNFKYIKNRISRMGHIKISPLEATYLAWLDVSALNLPNPVEYFESHGVGMSSGESFGDKNFVRMNFACSRETLKTAIDRIEKAITGLSIKNE